MTNTYGPEIPKLKMVDSIFYHTPNGVWAPGIAFPSGSANPTKSSTCHDRDFYYGIQSGHLWQYQGGDYPAGDWHDLGTAANAITSCGTTIPGSGEGTELELFNRYDSGDPKVGEIYQKIDNAWRNVGSNQMGLPLSTAAINFTDSSKDWRQANLGLLLVSDDGSSPLLATDVGFVVKKDITAGGYVGANQGELWLGHGRANATDNPKIVLMHSTGSYFAQQHPGQAYDTLYLTKYDGETSAHLDLGNLTAHGNILIEKDTPQIRLNSISATNDPSIIFYDNSVIKISQGYDVENDLLYFYDHINSRTAMSLTHNGDFGAYRNITAGGFLNALSIKVGGTEIVSASRALANVTANASIITSGVFGTARLGSGTASSSTYLRGDSTWTTLPSQQWTAGIVSSIASPLAISSNVLSMSQANSSTNGYLSSSDWTTFNSKYGSGSAPSFTGISMSGNIIPTASGSYYCGSSSFPWQIVDTQYLYANTINALTGSAVSFGSAIKSNVNGAGYCSYYGGGGGGANGGIYLDEYGWVRFNGSNDTYWYVRTNTGNEVLAVPNATGTTRAIWISCNMNPNGAGVLGCGSGSSYWSGVVTNTIYRRNESSFDALDDLGLAKNYKTKTVVENGLEKEIVDIESLPHLKADPTVNDVELANFWDESKVSGFLLGCVKALVNRVEALEDQLKQTSA